MTYTRFEEVPVWRDAAQLARDVFELVEDKSFHMRGDLASQLARAGLSVSNNIAEGFGRGTKQELITFIFIAEGSVDEVRSMLAVMLGMRRFAHLASRISHLSSTCESISRQLTAWAINQQGSAMRGRRYIDGETQQMRQKEQSREQFIAKLQILAPPRDDP